VSFVYNPLVCTGIHTVKQLVNSSISREKNIKHNYSTGLTVILKRSSDFFTELFQGTIIQLSLPFRNKNSLFPVMGCFRKRNLKEFKIQLFRYLLYH